MVETSARGEHYDAHWEDLPGHTEAEKFHAIATGKLVKLTDHLEEWLATTDDTAKTKDMKRSDVNRLAVKFPTAPEGCPSMG